MTVLDGIAPEWLALCDLERLAAIQEELAAEAVVPAWGLVLEALRFTLPADVKVVIVGQDPYYTAGMAHGLCFSSRSSAQPSLKTIFAALERLGLRKAPAAYCDGRLDMIAAQGVLWLNRSLTTVLGRANAHKKQWAAFTHDLILNFCRAYPGAHFLLWGNDARALASAIAAAGGVVYEWSHPSPQAENRLDATRKFATACNHFADVNAALAAAELPVICWDTTAPVLAFSDGGCLRNGEPDARGSFAVVLVGGAFRGCVLRGELEARAYELTGATPRDRGLAPVGDAAAGDAAAAVVPPTNNRAEYLGIIYALLALLRVPTTGAVTLYSDSNICVRTLNEWHPARLAKGTEAELANFDLVRAAAQLLAELNAARRPSPPLVLRHVKAHTSRPAANAPAEERAIWLGNWKADEQASAVLEAAPAPGVVTLSARAPPALKSLARA